MEKNSHALKYTAPDHEKIVAVIKQYENKRPALILLLAYNAAMTPSEMRALRWENIIDDYQTIHMDGGRKIPVTEELAAALKAEAVSGCDLRMPILSSGQPETAYTREHISLLARNALKYSGIQGVSLRTLRIACILRWLQEYPRKRVSEMSGLHPNVLAWDYAKLLTADTESSKLRSRTDISLEEIEEIYEKHAYDYVGFLMAMTLWTGVSTDAVLDLTWESVDLTAGVISFPEKDVRLADAQIAFLRGIERDPSSPYVLVSPHTKTQYTKDSMGHKLKYDLDTEGYSGITLVVLQRAYDYIQKKNVIMAMLEEKGRVLMKDARRLLGVSSHTAKQVFDDMIGEGLLVRADQTFYDAKKTLPPEKYMEVIAALCEEKGSFQRGDFAKAVGLPLIDASCQLNKLVKEGKILAPTGYTITK